MTTIAVVPRRQEMSIEAVLGKSSHSSPRALNGIIDNDFYIIVKVQ
jgi:hypothetical protein